MWNGAWRASAHTLRQPCARNLLCERSWLHAATVLSCGAHPPHVARFSRSFASTPPLRNSDDNDSADSLESPDASSSQSSSASPATTTTKKKARKPSELRTLATGDGVSSIDYQIQRQKKDAKKKPPQPQGPSSEAIAIKKKMMRWNKQDLLVRRLREKSLASEQQQDDGGADGASGEKSRTGKTKPASKTTGDADDGSRLDFWRIMREKEEEASARNMANANIEYLCSLYPRKSRLDAQDWAVLHRTVREGFTSDQLTKYISLCRQNDAEREKSLAASDSAEDEYDPDDSEHWMPLLNILLHVQGLRSDIIPANLQGLRQRLKGKYGLAERILRQCWDLSLRDDIGQLNVKIPSDQVETLLSSNKGIFWLRGLADTHNAKIDIFRDDQILRITAEETSAIEAKEEVLRNIATIGSGESVTETEQTQ